MMVDLNSPYYLHLEEQGCIDEYLYGKRRRRVWVDQKSVILEEIRTHQIYLQVIILACLGRRKVPGSTRL